MNSIDTSRSRARLRSNVVAWWVIALAGCGQAAAPESPPAARHPADAAAAAPSASPTDATGPDAEAPACTDGDRRCAGGAMETCANAAWSAAESCAPGACVTDGPATAHCAAGGSDAAAPLIAIFSAFPAETAPLLAAASIDSTKVVNGHTFRIGTLHGVRVAIGLTGMGLPNATATAHAVLAALPVSGVVFSGVAGSTLRIGDVVVPTSWSLRTSATYAPNAAWLQMATDITASNAVCLDKCTVVPATGLPVCLDHVPAVAVGGAGQSDDVSVPLACQAGGDDVFGCDVGAPSASANTCQSMGPAAPASGSGPIATDNETAAVAAEAAARGVPFIAFRGVSDGAGDPLGLPGYPTQFFAYYRLAARNAAAATVAFIGRMATTAP
jgi:nucleoside phosphorylase